MKKLITLTLSVLAWGTTRGQAQYIPEEEDWFIYDITYNSLLDVPSNYGGDWRSLGHNFSLMDDIVLGTSKFSLAYGITYSSQNYHSNYRLSIDSSGSGIFDTLASGAGYKSNKLNAKYFEIPLEVRFRGKPNEKGKFFRFYVGARVGVRFTGYAKYKDDQLNVRYYNPEELNRWRAGIYTRIGFGYFSAYAYYGLTSVYSDIDAATGPAELNSAKPLSIGISLAL